MKTLYIECKMGAAGDMLMGALYELLDAEHKQKYLNMMNTLFGADIHITAEENTKCGIIGTHMNVKILEKNETPAENIYQIKADDEIAFSPNAEVLSDDIYPKSVEITTGHVHTRTLGSSTSSHIRKTTEHSHVSESHHEHDHENHMFTHEHTHENHTLTHEHSHSHGHSHNHYTYASILRKLRILPIPESIREHAGNIYRIIGEAEGKVHNTSIEHIHFHEVGTMDAIADVLGCCILFSFINADQIVVSPIHVGNGTVTCAHGVLPVPTPATAEILKGIPYYTGDIQSELCTPTGAAILKYYATSFSSMPVMITAQSGFGLGTKDFPIANGVRTFLGETMNIQLTHLDNKDCCSENSNITDYDEIILELSCNLDDMTGESIGYAMDILFENGALDVFYIPIQMKKNRPGIIFTCLCNMDEKNKFTKLIFEHTSTRGIRYKSYFRDKLDFTVEEIDTSYGIVHKKISSGHNIEKYKLEYDDIKKIAHRTNSSFDTVMKNLNSSISNKNKTSS